MEYFVRTNIKHNGARFVRGLVIELTEANAASLLASGVIQTAPVGPEEQKPVQESDGQVDATAGGEPVSSGEPSLDGQAEEAVRTEAEDITPKLADMKRGDLETVAISEGVDGEAVANAANKGAVIDLIEANRAQKDAPAAEPKQEEPQIDPSANL